MNQRFIVIDGKTYNSLEEMPPDVRAKYEQAMQKLQSQNVMNILGDKNQNGIPDILENAATNIASANMKFIVDGKELDNLQDLPPEKRQKYEQAMKVLDKNQNGIPDFVENMMNVSNQSSNIQDTPVMTTPSSYSSSDVVQSSPLPVSSPTITPDTSNGWALALGGFLILFLCVAGIVGLWYFFIR